MLGEGRNGWTGSGLLWRGEVRWRLKGLGWMFDAFVSLFDLQRWRLKIAVPGIVVRRLFERLCCSRMPVCSMPSRRCGWSVQNLVFEFQW